VVIAKSLILWDVKGWDDTTDLDTLAGKILAMEIDGLVWKTEFKKEPVAYGINKLVVGCVIEDAKVSTDDLSEKICEEFEEFVQSCDVAVFSKI
jgi:translation elongation factor EF-1beta